MHHSSDLSIFSGSFPPGAIYKYMYSFALFFNFLTARRRRAVLAGGSVFFFFFFSLVGH